MLEPSITCHNALVKEEYRQSQEARNSFPVFNLWIRNLRFFFLYHQMYCPFFSCVKTDCTCIKSSSSNAFQMVKKHVKIQKGEIIL